MPTGIMEIWNARHALLFLVLLPVVLWNVEGQREKLEDWCWGYAVHTFCQLYNAENICEAQSGYNWTVLEWQSSLSLLRTAQQGKPDPCNPVGPNKGRIVGEHGPLPGWVMICYDCFLWPTKYVSFRWRLVLQMIFWMQGLKNIIPNFFQSLGAIPLSSAMSERHSETVYFYCVIRVCPYFSRKSHSIPEPANIDTIVSDAAWIVSESEKCVSPIEVLGLNPVIQMPHSTQASGIYFRCRQLS